MKFIIILCVLILRTQFEANCQTWGDSRIKNERIFISVEVAAKFPGGMNAFYKFIADNLKMPTDNFSLTSNRVVMSRVYIDTTGKVRFAEIEKGVNINYNTEVIEMIKKMPIWSPATQNGRKVFAVVSIPIKFID